MKAGYYIDHLYGLAIKLSDGHDDWWVWNYFLKRWEHSKSSNQIAVSWDWEFIEAL